MTAQVTNESAFEEGSLGIQVVLCAVTLGLYGFYWFYNTAEQLDDGTDANLNPILALVPIYGAWIVADAAEAVTDQDGIILFALLMLLGPVGWYLIQSGINDVAAGA